MEVDVAEDVEDIDAHPPLLIPIIDIDCAGRKLDGGRGGRDDSDDPDIDGAVVATLGAASGGGGGG